MKPKVYISDGYIRIESDFCNDITITDAHSFLKDLVSVMYDYHKLYAEKKVGNYVKGD